jgi:mannosyl-3-phosphoglycerate phosphatase
VSRLVIVTDLDGTLLDHDTYSFAPARPALVELRRRLVPLVLCTSKTRAEVEALRRRLKNRHPFIVENGGGLFVPRGYFERGTAGRMELGRPYSEIVAALSDLARKARVQVRGFHQLSAREIAELTGLPLAQARLARSRFVRLARRSGYGVTTGGRLWHLFRGSDKGLAVRRLLALYRRSGRFRTLALGDAANDLPMFREVDQAVLLPRPDGRYDRAVLRAVPGVIRGSAPGPEGWNEAVLRALQSTPIRGGSHRR